MDNREQSGYCGAFRVCITKKKQTFSNISGSILRDSSDKVIHMWIIIVDIVDNTSFYKK